MPIGHPSLAAFARGRFRRSPGSQSDPDEPPPPEELDRPPLGLNTDFLTYYSSDFPAKNAMWKCGTWAVANADLVVFTSGCPLSSLSLRSDGYPTELPQTIGGYAQGQVVHTNLFGGTQSGPLYYPAGTYTIYFDGTGSFRVRGDGGTLNASSSPFTYTVSTPSSGGINLVIRTSSVSDPVRNVRVLMPGVTLESYESNPWNSHYADLISGFGIHRFMNWMGTNNNGTNNPVTSWASRVPVGHYSYQSMAKGLPLELIVDFCNRYLIHPWLNWHHGATSDYIQHAAEYLEANLDPRLVIRGERSNEIWNPLFPQHAHFRDAGIAAGMHTLGNFQGPSSDPGARFWAALKMQARVQAQDYAILEDVFGVDSPRLRKVIGSFVANHTQTRVLLESYEDPAINPLGGTLQEIAIAPYWGVATVNALEANPALSTATMMAGFVSDAYTETSTWIAAHEPHCITHNVDLSFYEWGLGAHSPDAAANARILEARRHPLMEDAYNEFFRACTEADLYHVGCHLGFIFPPSVSGSWGALEHEFMDLEDAPTWTALQARLLNPFP